VSPTGGASPAIIEVAEEPNPDLAALRSIDPPPALVAHVMTRVSETPPTVWQWLTRPIVIELRISPLGVLTLTVLLAIGLAIAFAR
jgi:hypothetical protein